MEHKLKNILRAGVPQGNGRAGKKTLGKALEKKGGGQSSMGLVPEGEMSLGSILTTKGKHEK